MTDKYCCSHCGHSYGEHTIARPDEIETLLSLGFTVYDCDSIDEDTPFLEGEHRWVWVEKDGVVADCLEIEETCKNVEPDDPCDSDFMKEISS